MGKDNKRTMKRIIFCFAFLTMVFTLTIICGTSAEIAGGQAGNYTWTIDDGGVLTLSGTGINTNSDEEHPWTEYAEQVVSIVLTEGLERIPDESFLGFKKITSITFPDSVTFIGNDVLKDCTALKEVNLPSGDTVVGDAFMGCTALETIEIPEGVRGIAWKAFSGCTGLKKVTVSTNDMDLSIYLKELFNGCENLESVDVSEGNDSFTSVDGIVYTKDLKKIVYCPRGKTGDVEIPEGVEIIPLQMFYKCRNLTGVTIPASVTEILGGAFSDCTSLKTIVIPDSVTSLGGSIFNGCTSLEKAVLGKKITEIPVNGFMDCVKMREIQLPENLKIIGRTAFLRCQSLEKIVIPEGTTRIEVSAFGDCSAMTSAEIPDSVVYIGNSAFSGCENLASIHLPTQLKYLGTSAFRECKKAAGEIVIPSSIRVISRDTFTLCENITSFKLPEGLTSIEEDAFSFCWILPSIDIPASVRVIEENVFYACPTLETVIIRGKDTVIEGGALLADNQKTIWCPEGSVAEAYAKAAKFSVQYLEADGGNGEPDTEPEPEQLTDEISGKTDRFEWSLSKDGILTISGEIADSTSDHPWTDYADQIRSVVFQDNLTTIPDEAFYQVRNLTAITLPKAGKFIGNRSFKGCTALKSVVFPTEVTDGWICNECFEDCRSLESVIIPEGFTMVGVKAFRRCYALTKVTLSSTVTIIGGREGNSVSPVFGSCRSLTAVDISTENPVFSSADGVIFDKDQTILYYFPNGKEGDYDVPGTVKKINTGAFAHSGKLTGVTIPETVEIIGYDVFYSCKGLKTVRFLGMKTEILEGAFAGSDQAVIECYAGSAAEEYAKKYDIPYELLTEEKLKGHTLTLREKVNATCKETGTEEYWECEICKKYYTDEQGTNEIQAPVVLEKLAHTLERNSMDPGDKANELTYWKCSVCENLFLDEKGEQETDQPALNRKFLDAVKTVQNKAADALMQENDSKACWKLIQDAKETVTALIYDGTKTAAENRALAEAIITKLKEDLSLQRTAEAKETAEAAAANEVTLVIAALPSSESVQTADKTAIEAARDAYNALTADQQAMVSPEMLKKLTDAEAALAEAQKAEQTNQQTTPEQQPAPEEKISDNVTAGGLKYSLNHKKKTATVTGAEKKNLQKISIPATVGANRTKYQVTAIGDDAFRGLKKIESAAIGKNVTSIGKNAFRDCVKLKMVTGCTAVTTIGDDAFHGCEKLTKVPEMKKLTKIGAGAFRKCRAMTKFTIPVNVAKIGANAFCECEKLKTVTIRTTKLTAKNVGKGAFEGTPAGAAYQCPKGKKEAYQKILKKKGASGKFAETRK